jgi:hypothetical protein
VDERNARIAELEAELAVYRDLVAELEAHRELVTELRAQLGRVTELEATAEELTAEVERLRREVEQHSDVSGRPPSSDTLAQRTEPDPWFRSPVEGILLWVDLRSLMPSFGVTRWRWPRFRVDRGVRWQLIWGFRILTSAVIGILLPGASHGGQLQHFRNGTGFRCLLPPSSAGWGQGLASLLKSA